MPRSLRLLPDVERPDKQRLGPSVRTLRLVEPPKVVEADGYLEAMRVQRVFAKREAPCREWKRLLNLTFAVGRVHCFVGASRFIDHCLRPDHCLRLGTASLCAAG